jgi:DNA invertase Pin-like site-specific DNA recombinase
MRILAYCYRDPLLEPMPDLSAWTIAGCPIEQTYEDLAMVAAIQPRWQWQQLLADCRANPADYLLVRRLEDLGDSLPEVSDRLTELQTLGVKWIAIDQIDLTELSNLSTIAQPPTAELLQQLQQVQSNQRRRKSQQAHARDRLKALPPPGKAPYGYRRGKEHYLIDRTTAPVVKDFFEHFLLYGSLRGSVRHLAKQYGKTIAASTAHRWLVNPVYRGDLEYLDGKTIADTHAPIISREEAAQVDRLLQRNRRLPPRTAGATHSLAGLVVCGECQSPMTIAHVTAPRRQKAYTYLRPTACSRQPKCKSLAYDAVLQATIQRICADLPPAIATANLPNLDGMKSGIAGAIAAKQGILTQLAPLVTQGILDQATADLRAYNLRTELATLQAKLTQLPPENLAAIAQTVSIPQFWFDLSESERRFYLREFLRQITLTRDLKTWSLKLIFAF